MAWWLRFELVVGSRWPSMSPVASWNVSSPSFAPFRSRAFRLIWTGALVSNIGTWMETVALGYYVAETTGRASWAAVVAAAAVLPGAIVGPIGSEGVYATLTHTKGGGHRLSVGCWEDGSLGTLMAEVKRRRRDLWTADEATQELWTQQYRALRKLGRAVVARWTEAAS